MTAVSQRISNFLGGVSQQADEKLFPGQVKDALNCYPDPTLGMIKRPGGKYISQLAGSPSGKDGDAWFFVFRDDLTKYIVSIARSNGLVRVWDITTGVEQSVSYSGTIGTGNATKAYLSASDYRSLKALTINDFTYIVNTEKVVSPLSTPSWNPNRQATIVVNSVEYDTQYKVTINGTDYTYTTTATSSPPLKLADVTAGLSSAITAGYTTKTVIDNTIYLTHTAAIDVKAVAGLDGKDLRVFQDSVDSFNRLPEQAFNNQVVKVSNTSADKDDYYLKFIADNGVSGKGYWEETVAPTVSLGLDPATMPVVLLNMGDGTFRVAQLNGDETINGLPLQWENRLVGDDDSNSHPSFVGSNIADIFLFNNRLGFLTQDNVSMSQAGDYWNFYHKTATTQTVADPIDLSCASIKPAVLHSVVPIPQGLLLFSANQQFLMEAGDGDAWTPANVTIRSLSNYECDKYIKPADLGSTVMFVSKNPSWSRAFEIFTRGQKEAPSVNESSKIVPEWIPESITNAIGSSQNGLWVASARDSTYLYLFRYYEEGDERKMASWVRWDLYSNVIQTAFQNDTLYVLTSGTEGYNVITHKLVLSPSTSGLTNSLGNKVDPYLDGWSEITTLPTYSNGQTKVYIPTYYDTNKELQYVVGLQKATRTSPDIPYNTIVGVDQNLLNLDIYHFGETAVAARPVVVYIHGGAWVGGDKDSVDSKAKFFNSKGYIFISVNYRLSDVPSNDYTTWVNTRLKYPTHINDCANALGWTYANIDDYGGDPSKLILVGHSAGAQLVSLLGTNQSFITAAGVPSSALKGVVSVDTEGFDVKEAIINPAGGAIGTPTSQRRFYQNVFGIYPDASITGTGSALTTDFANTTLATAAYAQASPQSNISATTPPFLVLGRGPTARTTGQQAFVTAMQSASRPVTYVSYPNDTTYTHEEINTSIGATLDPPAGKLLPSGIQNVTTQIFNFVSSIAPAPSAPVVSANTTGLSNIIIKQTDGGGDYFDIPGNVVNNYIYVGYSYDMEIQLPRYDYSSKDQGYDFTGYTTTARMKFYTGLGGSVSFNIKDNTRTEWTDTSGVQIADTYSADTAPYRESYTYKVPVYQRPDNYIMKVISNNPFPVSLVAMQWEGQYSPGFYRRA